MGRLISLPTSYDEATDTLDGRTTRRVANNTRLVADPDGAIAVRLHHTDIVTFYPDGTILLDTGGWDTVTTRARMRACGLDVFHKAHRLYLGEQEITRAALIYPHETVRAC